MRESERETLGWRWQAVVAVKDGLNFGYGLREKLEGASHGGSTALSFSHLDLSALHSLSLTLLEPVITLFDLSFLC